MADNARDLVMAAVDGAVAVSGNEVERFVQTARLHRARITDAQLSGPSSAPTRPWSPRPGRRPVAWPPRPRSASPAGRSPGPRRMCRMSARSSPSDRRYRLAAILNAELPPLVALLPGPAGRSGGRDVGMPGRRVVPGQPDIREPASDNYYA